MVSALDQVGTAGEDWLAALLGANAADVCRAYGVRCLHYAIRRRRGVTASRPGRTTTPTASIGSTASRPSSALPSKPESPERRFIVRWASGAHHSWSR